MSIGIFKRSHFDGGEVWLLHKVRYENENITIVYSFVPSIWWCFPPWVNSALLMLQNLSLIMISILCWLQLCSFFLQCIKSPSGVCLHKLFVSPFFYTNVCWPFKDRNPKLYVLILSLEDFLWMDSKPTNSYGKIPNKSRLLSLWCSFSWLMSRFLILIWR